MVFHNHFRLVGVLFLFRSKREFAPIFGFFPNNFAFPRFSARVFGFGLVFNNFTGLFGDFFRSFGIEKLDFYKPPADLLLFKRHFDFHDFFPVFLVGQDGRFIFLEISVCVFCFYVSFQRIFECFK